MTVLRRLGAGFYRAVSEQGALDLVTRLTLVLLLLSDWMVGEDWRFKAPLRLLALFGLVSPPLHRSRWLWLTVTLLLAGKSVDNWWVQDNHQFLLTYLSIALTVALFSGDDAERILAANAKLLVGLSFAFATLWKGFLSPDFVDGTYFHYTFLTDERFRVIPLAFGGIGEELYRANRLQLGQLFVPGADTLAVTLESTPRLALLAHLVTWWTLAIEAALAVLFLWPGTGGPARFRHAALLLFAWTTYLVANVEAFGWTLLTLGAAQCGPSEGRTRFLYAATCGLVLLYDYLPILAFVEDAL